MLLTSEDETKKVVLTITRTVLYSFVVFGCLLLAALIFVYYKLIWIHKLPFWAAPLPIIVGTAVYIWHRLYIWAKGKDSEDL